jgi:hypothetical protein
MTRHENHKLQPETKWQYAILVARRVHVGADTPRRTAASHGIGIGGTSDERT